MPRTQEYPDDLQRAIEIALEMVTKHRMDQKVDQRIYLAPAHPFLPNAPSDRGQAAEAMAREIDMAVKDIVDRAFSRATKLLCARRTDLDEGIKLLLSKETITADEFPANRSGGTDHPAAAA